MPPIYEKDLDSYSEYQGWEWKKIRVSGVGEELSPCYYCQEENIVSL